MRAQGDAGDEPRPGARRRLRSASDAASVRARIKVRKRQCVSLNVREVLIFSDVLMPSQAFPRAPDLRAVVVGRGGLGPSRPGSQVRPATGEWIGEVTEFGTRAQSRDHIGASDSIGLRTKHSVQFRVVAVFSYMEYFSPLGPYLFCTSLPG